MAKDISKYVNQAVLVVRTADGFVLQPFASCPVGLSSSTLTVAQDLGYSSYSDNVLGKLVELMAEEVEPAPSIQEK